LPNERAVLLLHGHGGSPDLMAPVAHAVSAATRARVLVPRAPLAVDGGWAWWGDDDDGPAEHLVDSLAAVVTGVDEVVVAGFSQGGALALALPFGDRVACVGGFLAGQAPGHRPSVLIAHSDDDPTVDPQYARMAARRCRAAGCTVVEHWHDGGHAWPPSVTEALLGLIGVV
jgi:predicted esterase